MTRLPHIFGKLLIQLSRSKINNCHGHFKCFIITHPHEFHYWPEVFHCNFFTRVNFQSIIWNRWRGIELSFPPACHWLYRDEKQTFEWPSGLGICSKRWLHQSKPHWLPLCIYLLSHISPSAIGQVWNQTNKDGPLKKSIYASQIRNDFLLCIFLLSSATNSSVQHF